MAVGPESTFCVIKQFKLTLFGELHAITIDFTTKTRKIKVGFNFVADRQGFKIVAKSQY